VTETPEIITYYASITIVCPIYDYAQMEPIMLKEYAAYCTRAYTQQLCQTSEPCSKISYS